VLNSTRRIGGEVCRSTTMETYTESLELVVVQKHRPKRNRRHQIFQLTLPMLNAVIGISLGTLTGISLAIVSTRADASITMNPSSLTHFVGSHTGLRPGENSDLTQHSQPDATTRTVASASQPTAGGCGEDGARPASSDAPVNPPVRMGRSPEAQPEPSKIPTIDENEEGPIHPALPAETHPVKPVAHPLTKPPRTLLASAPESVPAPLDGEQLSLDGGARPSTFYSEGDLMIANYDAATGTIETSDGKTFSLGLTVSTANATSWEDYRAGVHYRCSQDGSCMLARAGVIVPNARLI
jgi:hypothetical protein